MSFRGPGPGILGTPQFEQKDDKFKPPNASGAAGVFDITAAITEAVRKDPAVAGQLVRGLMVAAATIASALSFIPFTNNFGGALSSVLIGSIFRPFEQKSVSGPVEDWLDNYFPTREANARLLVSAIEAGVIDEGDLVSELVDAGTKDHGIQAIVKLARAKRFDSVTREDLLLVRRYNDALIDAEIRTRQDQERDVINDLVIRRRELLAELRRRARKSGGAA